MKSVEATMRPLLVCDHCGTFRAGPAVTFLAHRNAGSAQIAADLAGNLAAEIERARIEGWLVRTMPNLLFCACDSCALGHFQKSNEGRGDHDDRSTASRGLLLD